MLSGDCFVMVGGALWTYFAAFLATSRERRDAAQDFYAGQAVTPRLRTQAALLSTGAAGIAGVVLIGIATLVFAGFDGVVTIDPQRYPGQPLPPRSYTLQLIELAQGPAYLIAAGTLGVLAGTWTRQLLLAVLGALVLFLSPVALVPRLVYDDHASAGVYGAVQVAGPLGWHFASWHLLAITAVAALAAAMALVRHDRGPRVALLALLGLGAAIAVVELGQRLPW
jgi:hypothetical protein